MWEKKNYTIDKKYYYAANPKIIFTSKPLLTQGGKDPI